MTTYRFHGKDQNDTRSTGIGGYLRNETHMARIINTRDIISRTQCTSRMHAAHCYDTYEKKKDEHQCAA